MKLNKHRIRQIDHLRTHYARRLEALLAVQAQATKLVSELNTVINEANQLREAIVRDGEAYADAKSESWQESDSGQAYEEWSSAWSNEIEPVVWDLDLSQDIPAEILSEYDYPHDF